MILSYKVMANGVLRKSQNDVRHDLGTIRNRSLQGSNSGPLGRVASFLGLNRQGLQTVVVLIVAVLTEVSALVMASLQKYPSPCSQYFMVFDQNPLAGAHRMEEFLEVLKHL